MFSYMADYLLIALQICALASYWQNCRWRNHAIRRQCHSPVHRSLDGDGMGTDWLVFQADIWFITRPAADNSLAEYRISQSGLRSVCQVYLPASRSLVESQYIGPTLLTTLLPIRHAGRSTININDVMLLARRNEGLESILKAFVDQQKEAAQQESQAEDSDWATGTWLASHSID